MFKSSASEEQGGFCEFFAAALFWPQAVVRSLSVRVGASGGLTDDSAGSRRVSSRSAMVDRFPAISSDLLFVASARLVANPYRGPAKLRHQFCNSLINGCSSLAWPRAACTWAR